MAERVCEGLQTTRWVGFHSHCDSEPIIIYTSDGLSWFVCAQLFGRMHILDTTHYRILHGGDIAWSTKKPPNVHCRTCLIQTYHAFSILLGRGDTTRYTQLVRWWIKNGTEVNQGAPPLPPLPTDHRIVVENDTGVADLSSASKGACDEKKKRRRRRKRSHLSARKKRRR